MTELQTAIKDVRGFKCAGVHAGLKKDGILDFALIVSDKDCVTAGVFTKNAFKAAPVLVNMEHLQTHSEKIRAVAINTISANAATGELGLANSRKMAQLVAQRINCKTEQVIVMSTGVIGTHLPMTKIENGIKNTFQQLGDNWGNAASAITTTDQFSKLASITVETEQGSYTIAGITKGAGMIAPNMATMLGILVTDAKLSSSQTQKMLTDSANLSYNRIVVDGDTSTNDMVVLLANGESGISLSSEEDESVFFEALIELSTYLAQQVVRDGEGATKFITIDVRGAESDTDAEKIAHTIAASPLVKTAFYGNDANWGRLIMAAGRSGIEFNPDRLSIWMAAGEKIDRDRGDCGLLLLQNGMKADYDENEATAIISHDSVYVTLDFASGDGEAIVWTCDFSHEYISINADYRT